MMRSLWFGFATLLLPLVIGCSSISPSGGSGASASANLASLLQFGAYPGAKLVREQIQPSSFAIFPLPGKYGYRIYETKDSPQVVVDYYRKLGEANGWAVSLDNRNYQPLSPYISMKAGSYNLELTREDMSDGGIPIPQPTPSPGASPTPVPSGSPSPYWFRVSGEVVD